MREILEAVHDWGMADNRQTREDKATFDIQCAPTRLDGWEDTILDWTSVIIIPVFLKSCSPSYFFIPLPPPFLSLLFVPPSRALEPDKEAIQCDIFCDNFQKLSFFHRFFSFKSPCLRYFFCSLISFREILFLPHVIKSGCHWPSISQDDWGWLKMTFLFMICSWHMDKVTIVAKWIWWELRRQQDSFPISFQHMGIWKCVGWYVWNEIVSLFLSFSNTCVRLWECLG